MTSTAGNEGEAEGKAIERAFFAGTARPRWTDRIETVDKHRARPDQLPNWPPPGWESAVTPTEATPVGLLAWLEYHVHPHMLVTGYRRMNRGNAAFNFNFVAADTRRLMDRLAFTCADVGRIRRPTGPEPWREGAIQGELRRVWQELCGAEWPDAGHFEPALLHRESAPPEQTVPFSKPVSEPDGPVEPYKFRYAGKAVDFSKALLRYRLVVELWDRKAGRPHTSRDAGDVMDEIYHARDSDGAFSKLRQETNADFRRAGLPLVVKFAGGKVWLEPVP